jgi:glyoxalase superfamily protein
MHPDLITADLEAEVERLVGLGATWKADVKLGSVRWTTLLDPEGNEFDVIAEGA